MTCPTCEATMQSLGETKLGFRWLWCPRCGTLKDDNEKSHVDDAIDVPILAKKVRLLVTTMRSRSELLDSVTWLRRLHTMGIIEACLLPEDRPQA